MRAFWLAFVGVGVGLLLPATAYASEAKVVQLEAHGEPLRGIAGRLSAATGVPIVVDREVPAVRVHLVLRGVTLDHALQVIIRQVSRDYPQVEYAMEDTGFRIYVAPPSPLPAPSEPEIADRVVVTARTPSAGPRGDAGITGGRGGGYRPGPLLVRGGTGFSQMSIRQGGRGANYRATVSGSWGWSRYAYTSGQPGLGTGVGPGLGRPTGQGGYGRRPF